MTHKADDAFFEHKRDWSKRKDEILSCYLTAYLPKIMQVKKPVLIVDGFAGPGKFADGNAGSPLIICSCIVDTLAKKLRFPQSVAVWCIESKLKHFQELKQNLVSFPFAQARLGTFSDFADDIAQATRTQSVFLYVDPFTVEGLHWDELDRIFRGLNFNSVEILLNLNASSFVRRGPRSDERENGRRRRRRCRANRRGI